VKIIVFFYEIIYNRYIERFWRNGLATMPYPGVRVEILGDDCGDSVYREGAMTIQKTEEATIITGMVVMLFLLMPILNPWITAGLGVAMIVIFLVIHYSRLRRNAPGGQKK
jgi:hypothetical protein